MEKKKNIEKMFFVKFFEIIVKSDVSNKAKFLHTLCDRFFHKIKKTSRRKGCGLFSTESACSEYLLLCRWRYLTSQDLGNVLTVCSRRLWQVDWLAVRTRGVENQSDSFLLADYWTIFNAWMKHWFFSNFSIFPKIRDQWIFNVPTCVQILFFSVVRSRLS